MADNSVRGLAEQNLRAVMGPTVEVITATPPKPVPEPNTSCYSHKQVALTNLGTLIIGWCYGGYDVLAGDKVLARCDDF